MRFFRVIKYAVRAAGAITILLALVIYDEVTTKVVLINDSPYNLTQVRVGVGEADAKELKELFWTGDIKRGKTQWISRVADETGGLAISFVINGEKVALTYGYVSGAALGHGIKVRVKSKENVVIDDMKTILGFFI